jgi:hypothetical protein
MFFNRQERPIFGKRETLSPAEALRKLYETDDEVALALDTYAKQREQMFAFADMTVEDRNLLEGAELQIVSTLAEHGIDVAHETLEEFMKTL